MNIFLIRHGETDKSESMRDWKYPITEKGHKQAKIAGEFLKDFFAKNNLDLSSTTIYHSPYIRTTETCREINNILDLQSEKTFELAEYQEGSHIDTPNQFMEILTDNPLLTKIYTKAQESDNSDSESPAEIILRAKQFLDQVKNSGSENIIVITHNGFIRAFDIAFNNGSVVEYFEKRSIKNCSIRHYEIKQNDFINHGEILHSTRDYSHLLDQTEQSKK